MKKVDSSNIAAVHYDPETKLMTIRFHSGDSYQYKDVPENEYRAFLDADSIGSHFHKHVKTKFQYRKL